MTNCIPLKRSWKIVFNDSFFKTLVEKILIKKPKTWHVKGQKLLSIRIIEIIYTKQNWRVIIKQKYTVTIVVNIEVIVVFVINWQ